MTIPTNSSLTMVRSRPYFGEFENEELRGSLERGRELLHCESPVSEPVILVATRMMFGLRVRSSVCDMLTFTIGGFSLRPNRVHVLELCMAIILSTIQVLDKKHTVV